MISSIFESQTKNCFSRTENVFEAAARILCAGAVWRTAGANGEHVSASAKLFYGPRFIVELPIHTSRLVARAPLAMPLIHGSLAARTVLPLKCSNVHLSVRLQAPKSAPAVRLLLQKADGGKAVEWAVPSQASG